MRQLVLKRKRSYGSKSEPVPAHLRPSSRYAPPPGGPTPAATSQPSLPSDQRGLRAVTPEELLQRAKAEASRHVLPSPAFTKVVLEKGLEHLARGGLRPDIAMG